MRLDRFFHHSLVSLSTLLVLSLAACGDDSNGSPADDDSDAATDAAMPDAGQDTVGGEDVDPVSDAAADSVSDTGVSDTDLDDTTPDDAISVDAAPDGDVGTPSDATTDAQTDTSGGLAPPFDFGDDDEAIALAMSGEWDVFVTTAPEDSDLGPATLRVSWGGADSPFVITLVSADGRQLAERSSPALNDRTVSDGAGVSLWDAAVGAGYRPLAEGPGRRVGIYNYFEAGNSNESPFAYADVSFFESGQIVGQVAGWAFRNGVVAGGVDAPAVFIDLAGTWYANRESLACEPRQVEVSIEGNGVVLITGTSSVTCEPSTVEAIWDGQDDFLATLADGTHWLVVNSAAQGGSLPGGGVFMRLDAAENPSEIKTLLSNLAGGAGNLDSVDIVRAP